MSAKAELKRYYIDGVDGVLREAYDKWCPPAEAYKIEDVDALLAEKDARIEKLEGEVTTLHRIMNRKPNLAAAKLHADLEALKEPSHAE